MLETSISGNNYLQIFRSIRALIRDFRHGWLSVTVFYAALTLVAFAAYFYLAKLPQAQGVPTAWGLLRSKGDLWEGLSAVWFIFAWGFGIQLLIQVWRVLRRRPRDADMSLLLRHGAWASAHAGLFEEIVFRAYAFLAAVITLKVADDVTHGWLRDFCMHTILPALNFVTLGLFSPQFGEAANWALGMGILLGSLFFRSAHIHYGKLSKANVWVIGMVMFWLMFNYGLVTAIIAHFLYDLCVFGAIALTSPLQPRAKAAS